MTMLAVTAGMLVCSGDKVLSQAGFVIKDGKVTAVMANKNLERWALSHDCSLVDASDAVVIPGFIDAHTHQYGLFSHGIPMDVPVAGFRDFLEDFWWPRIENRLQIENVTVSALFSGAEMIRSGVTGFCDTLEAPYALPKVLVQQAGEIEKLGLRAILSLESSERISEENGLACLEENRSFIEWCHKRQSLIQGMICTHTSFTCSPSFLRKAQSLAEEYGVKWHFHLSESTYESEYCLRQYGKRAVQFYHEAGLLSPQVLASQCVQIDAAERQMLKKSGAGAVHMPLSNCEVGGGIAPVPEMLAVGMQVGLGSDGYITDFFSVMRGAFLIHKGNLQNASVMPAQEVFKMATEYGAKVLGWADVGRLEPGYAADFVILDNLFPTPLTRKNVFDQLVVHGAREMVRSVFVVGNPVMLDHKLQQVDIQAAAAALKNQVSVFWEEQ